MRLHLILAATSAFALLLAQAPRADAGPVPTPANDLFALIQNTKFSAGVYFNTHPSTIPDPYSVGFLTLTTGGHNVIYDAGSAPFMPAADAFASSIHSAIDGQIVDINQNGPYDRLGFRIGNLIGHDFTDVTLTFASGATYSTILPATPIQTSGAFYGFIAPAGEFFTGFSLSAHGPDSRVALEDVIIAVSGTPEPASWALMIIGFGAVGASVRIRRRRGAQSA